MLPIARNRNLCPVRDLETAKFKVVWARQRKRENSEHYCVPKLGWLPGQKNAKPPKSRPAFGRLGEALAYPRQLGESVGEMSVVESTQRRSAPVIANEGVRLPN